MEEASTLKQQKEDFVTGHQGSSFGEVLLITTVIIIGTMLRKALLPKSHQRRRHSWLNLMIDFVFVVFPGICVVTVASDHALYIGSLMFLGTLSLPFLTSSIPKKQIHPRSQIIDSLSEYRAVLCLYTYICILAVDFKVFPRRFAKAETYGAGLMDIGVGSFVVADALISKLDFHCHCDAHAAQKRVWRYRKAAFPLLAIGVVRVVAVKMLDYQEHVSEYGVHWNFFLTFAVMKAMAPLVPQHMCLGMGLGILLLYEVSLLSGLSGIINSANRSLNVLSQNKEGLLSLIGYFSLHNLARFCASITGISAYVNECTKCTTSRKSGISLKDAVLRTSILAGLLWILAIMSNTFVERVSRRSVNATYVFWTMANNLTWLLSFYMARFVLGLDSPVRLCMDMNKFSFHSFLYSNVAVGVVNTVFNTLEASTHMAICVVALYMLSVCVLTHTLSLYHQPK